MVTIAQRFATNRADRSSAQAGNSGAHRALARNDALDVSLPTRVKAERGFGLTGKERVGYSDGIGRPMPTTRWEEYAQTVLSRERNHVKRARRHAAASSVSAVSQKVARRDIRLKNARIMGQ
jgi:hypothetical protein